MNFQRRNDMLKTGFPSTEILVKLRFFSKKCHEYHTSEVKKQNGGFVNHSLMKLLWENVIKRNSFLIIILEKRTVFKDFLSLIFVI